MKLAIIGDNYRYGGAAIATSRLYHGLDKEAINVIRFVPEANAVDSQIITYARPKLSNILAKIFLNIFGKDYLVKWFFSILYEKTIIHELKKINPHIINIHNLHGVFHTPSLVKRLYDKNYKITKDANFIYFPVLKKSIKGKYVNKKLEKIKQDQKYKEIIKENISAADYKKLPTSFDVIGDIIIIEINDEIKKYEKQIAEALLKTNKNWGLMQV